MARKKCVMNVGYAQSGLKNGNTIAGVQFVNISNESATPLQSIIPVGDDVSDNVVLQTLDFAGRTVNSYMWINWAGDNGDQEAWVNDETILELCLCVADCERRRDDIDKHDVAASLRRRGCAEKKQKTAPCGGGP